MKFKQSVEEQLTALNEEYKTLTTQQRKTGASFFNRVLQPAHAKYLESTKANCGFFKSRIPGTSEYKARSEFETVLETARSTINVLRGW